MNSLSGHDPSHEPALLDAEGAYAYEGLVASAASLVAERVRNASRPFTGVEAATLSREVDAVDLDAPLGGTAEALAEVDRLYLRDAVWFHHPRYLAHLNCPVVLPALVGETVLSAVNSSMDTWDQSVGATLIEQKLVEWTAGRIGFGPAADGIFTSGGTQSNLQGLFLAREEALAHAEEAGVCRHVATSRLRILASDVSHFSVRRAAVLLGLGEEAVVPVHTDDAFAMCADSLVERVMACREAGLVPFAVVATAGSTDFGSIDPLHRVADVCTDAGMWMHVDAAYGCGLLASATRRDLLDGIERADSVTVDFHKTFFQPVSSSALIVRNGRTLGHSTIRADYLNPERHAGQRGVTDQVDKSLQTTRRFDALKLWLTLRVLGADAVGDMVDRVCDLAEQGWTVLARDRRFDVVVRPRLSTLVFRWVPGPEWGTVPATAVDAANLHAREAVFGSGEAVVASTTIDGWHYLKFTLLNPETTIEDVTEVLELLAGYAGAHLASLVPTANATDEVAS